MRLFWYIIKTKACAGRVPTQALNMKKARDGIRTRDPRLGKAILHHWATRALYMQKQCFDYSSEALSSQSSLKGIYFLSHIPSKLHTNFSSLKPQFTNAHSQNRTSCFRCFATLFCSWSCVPYVLPSCQILMQAWNFPTLAQRVNCCTTSYPDLLVKPSTD